MTNFKLKKPGFKQNLNQKSKILSAGKVFGGLISAFLTGTVTLSFAFVLSFSVPVFGAFTTTAEKDLFKSEAVKTEAVITDFVKGQVKNKTVEIRTVVFEKKDGRLFPRCRVSLKKYPEILPDFVKEMGLMAEEFAGAGENAIYGPEPEPSPFFYSSDSGGLEECDPDLSLTLTERAAYFSLSPPQLVAAPFYIAYYAAMNAGACALGALFGSWGGFQLAEEWEIGYRERRAEYLEKNGVGFLKYSPTEGELLTVISPALSGTLAGTTSYVAAKGYDEDWTHLKPKTGLVQKLRKKLGKKFIKLIVSFSGGFGALCGTAGAPVGFFFQKTQSAERNLQ